MASPSPSPCFDNTRETARDIALCCSFSVPATRDSPAMIAFTARAPHEDRSQYSNAIAFPGQPMCI